MVSFGLMVKITSFKVRLESKGDYECSRCLTTTEHDRKDSFEEIFSDSRESTEDVIPFRWRGN